MCASQRVSKPLQVTDGYGAQLQANLEPTKCVGRLRQQDGGHGSRNPLWSVARPIPDRRGKSQASMSRRARRLLQNLGREPGQSGHRCRSWFLPTLETAQTEVGSSGWKSTARRMVSGAFQDLENPENRVPLNRIRSPSRQNGSVTSGKGLALRDGLGGPSSEPVDCWWAA
ncbi:unnamed protein product [Brassica rapa subsp. narinosa]|uniref:(rape) hypothetical protein n=1 Tax=Brassica napus TaxID=3708 RepID=A0A816TIU3_BRANA|nr:unnamed protein product [Brassica napus]